MRPSHTVLLACALMAASLAAPAQQVYSSAQADPASVVRPLTACVYGGQVYSQGAIMPAGNGIVLKCMAAISEDRPAQMLPPVWATVLLETQGPVPPKPKPRRP